MSHPLVLLQATWQFELINTFTHIVFFDNLLYFFIYLKNMLIEIMYFFKPFKHNIIIVLT